jgi:hypothetical protein
MRKRGRRKAPADRVIANGNPKWHWWSGQRGLHRGAIHGRRAAVATKKKLAQTLERQALAASQRSRVSRISRVSAA